MSSQDKQLHTKQIYLPKPLMNDLSDLASKRNIAVTALINNILYDYNQLEQKKANDQDASKAAIK